MRASGFPLHELMLVYDAVLNYFVHTLSQAFNRDCGEVVCVWGGGWGEINSADHRGSVMIIPDLQLPLLWSPRGGERKTARLQTSDRQVFALRKAEPFQTSAKLLRKAFCKCCLLVVVKCK